MKVFVHPFQLNSEGRLNSQTDETQIKGVLIKVSHGDSSGYASFHRLPHFDKFSLEEVLEQIKSKNFLPEWQLAMTYAEQDLQSRKLGHDDLAGAFQLENHWLCTDLNTFTSEQVAKLKSDGFATIKIKVGRDLLDETELLLQLLEDFRNAKLKLRLDFNNSLNCEEFESWLKENQVFVENVEYFEDPFEYQAEKWKELAYKYSVNFALDVWPVTSNIDFDYSGAKYLVVKPARMNAVEWLKKLKDQSHHYFVVTHFMGHSLEIAHAASVAMKLKFFVRDRLKTCGLRPVAGFSYGEWGLESQSPHIQFAHDNGVGFSQKLESLSWDPIYEY